MYHPERNESDDSDDGVDIPDNEKVNPFTSLDLQLLKNSYKDLHEKYWLAKEVDFQNAYGKFFFTKLGELF